MYILTQKKIPIIGVGGIGTGLDAYEKIINGASMIQVYSMLAYKGPGCVRHIKDELAELLKKNNFASVSAAIGSAVNDPDSSLSLSTSSSSSSSNK